MGNICNSESSDQNKRHQSQEGIVVQPAGISARGSSHRSSAHEKPTSNELLSRHERRILRNSWADMKRFYPDFTKSVWMNALQRSMKMREVFGLMPECTEMDIRANKKFQRAASGILRFFEQLIIEFQLNNISIAVACADAGARHIEYYKSEFPAVFWDIFAVSLVEEFDNMGSNEDPEHQRSVYAWRKLVHFVIEQISQSYKSSRVDPNGELLD